MQKLIIKTFFVFLIVFLALQIVPKKYYTAISGNFYIEDFNSGKYLNTTQNSQCKNNTYNFKVIVSTFSGNSNHIFLIESDGKIIPECLNQIYLESVVNNNINNKKYAKTSEDMEITNLESSQPKDKNNNINNKKYGKTSEDMAITNLESSQLKDKNNNKQYSVDIRKDITILDLDVITFKYNTKYDYESPSLYFLLIYSLIVSIFYFMICRKNI